MSSYFFRFSSGVHHHFSWLGDSKTLFSIPISGICTIGTKERMTIEKAVQTMDTNTLEHRGMFTAGRYDHNDEFLAIRDLSDEPVSAKEVLSLQDVMEFRNIHWMKPAAKRYRAFSAFAESSPFSAGERVAVDAINGYFRERVQEIESKATKVPRKYKKQAERVSEFLDLYSRPIPAETVYWVAGNVPKALQAVKIGDLVRADKIIRADASPSMLPDWLSMDAETEKPLHGESLYTNGFIMKIRNATGFPSKYDFLSTEYLLPLGSEFHVDDIYSMNLEHCFELFTDITIIEATMVPIKFIDDVT